MESNKEFITRMILLINELPENKRRDHFTLLNFLDFQLHCRDNLVMEDFVCNLAARITKNVNFYGQAKLKKMVLEQIDIYARANQYTFKIPVYHKEFVQQALGGKADRKTIKNLKS
jgi:hypothetical protein